MEEIYLVPTVFIDSDSKTVVDFACEVCGNAEDDLDKAVALYYAVRDGFLYEPRNIDYSVEGMKASSVIRNQYGFCISKAMLLAAAARAVDVPSRLRFANVKNHLMPKKFIEEVIKTDIIYFHGYAELFVENKWVRATPAFNRSLCEKLNVRPLEFDGRKDSIFQQFDSSGKTFMKYLKDWGSFHDLPYDLMLSVVKKAYPEASLNIWKI